MTLTYTSGKISKIEDATGYRYLQLEYFSTGTRLLQYVKLYENTGTPTLKLTVEYGYSIDRLTSVKMGGTTVENYAYDVNSYLSGVTDGGGKTVASMKFLSATAGKLIREHTGDGDVAYTYGDSTCDSGNGVYTLFNRADASTTCTSDANCGAGNFCGGRDGTGGGWCFRARRCVSSTATDEHLVNLVTASCTSCRDTQDYDWDTTVLRAKGMKSADGIWTSHEYDANGMAIKQVENDSDSDPTTEPTGARVMHYFYGDTSFPGRLTETRIKSELKPASACSRTVATDCMQTIKTYTTGGQLDTTEQKGFTYDDTGATIPYDFTTDTNYDAQGRVTQVLGPLPGKADDVDFVYFAPGGLNGSYLNQRKSKKDETNYVITTYDEYDIWGQPKQVKDPNGKLVCSTFHPEYGLVASRRVLVGASQTNCSSTNTGTDETTSFTYDTHRRVTKVLNPRYNCKLTAYDPEGRISVVTDSDNNGGAGCIGLGDTTTYTYDSDSLVTRIEWADLIGFTSTVKRRQEYTYLADRRVDHVINPRDTAKFQDWAYDDDGVPNEVRWEDYVAGQNTSQTQWDVDNLDRTTAVRRYNPGGTNEQFSLTPGVQLDLPKQVADPASHNLDLVWDDLGRKVKQATPEGGTNFYVYNEHSQLTRLVMASGTADTKTTDYTYDYLDRRLTQDTGDVACSGGTWNKSELQYFYDALPAGVSCPSGSNCSQLAGRLAAVKVIIYCDSNPTDGAFDQWTFYSYKEGGRVAEHTVKDDSATPRVGRVVYTYDLNGDPTQIGYPLFPDATSTSAQYTYGSGAYNSDDDRIYQMARSGTTTLENVSWFPFGGGVETYTQEHGFCHPVSPCTLYKVKTDFTINLDYRLASIYARSTFTTPDTVFRIDYAEDARNRYTKRDFTYGSNGQKDMFFLYDNMNRATCRATQSISTCPGAGGAGQYETLTYNTSSDRTQLILNSSVIPNTTFNTYYKTSTSDQIDCIGIGAGTCASGARITYLYDTRGNRTSDDDSQYSGTSEDKRTYTYDGRNNLLTVAGKYYFSASTLHDYVVSYAYDERNRQIFKSFKDSTNGAEAQYFFYYDQYDRVVQAKYTPNVGTSSTYSIFQWYWLEQRPVLYYQLNYVTDRLSTTTRRYLESDEQGRPHAAWSWPTSGDTARVWEVEAGTWGWDVPTVGSTIYQPLRFPGQKYDADTEAVTLNGSAKRVLRPGLADDQSWTYDSFTDARYSLGAHTASAAGVVPGTGCGSLPGSHQGFDVDGNLLIGCCIDDDNSSNNMPDDGRCIIGGAEGMPADPAWSPSDCCPCKPMITECMGPYCGDGTCGVGETCANCPEDCGPCPVPPCPNGMCEPALGEDCDTCPLDCGECPAAPPDPTPPQPCSNPYKPCADHEPHGPDPKTF